MRRCGTCGETKALCDVHCRTCHAIATYERMGGTWRPVDASRHPE